MKKKEKLIGSIAILILGTIFLIAGYFFTKPDKYEAQDIFIEYSKDKNNYEQICQGSSENNKSSNSKKLNSEEKSNDYNLIEDRSNEQISNSDIIGEVVQMTGNNADNYIFVDIKGAVNEPGPYKLKGGSRILDLIEEAGGLSNEADRDTVHFSKILHDQDVIYIKKNGEAVREDIPQNNFVEDTIGDNTKSIAMNNVKSSNGKININIAALEELKKLPGIGDTKAESIIKYRENNGGFKSVEELTNVSGIGEKTLEKFVDMVDIE